MTKKTSKNSTLKLSAVFIGIFAFLTFFSEKTVQSAAPTIPANAMPGTLLYDHFGVTLALQGSQTINAGRNGNDAYAFDWNSFIPTKNTATVDWTESDWIGAWNDDFTDSTIQHPPATGTADQDWVPSAGEPYDTEAYYFDNDEDNYYFVIVTSIPQFSTDGSSSDVGVVDPRDIPTFGFGAAIRSGDLAINFFDGAARNENGVDWHYNYGVNLTQENRDSFGTFAGFARPNMHSTAIGTGLYSTDYDAGGTRLDGPSAVTTDWYTSAAPPSGGSGATGTTEGNWEHTNFDPLAAAFDGSFLGNTTVNYYEYSFPGGLEENDYPTYVYEITIPRSLFGVNDKKNGEQIGFMFGPGCRNDGNDVGNGTAQLIATVNDPVGSIGNYVWVDENNDGVQDAGERGIPNVTVSMTDGTSTWTTVTDSHGGYLFPDLPAGNYTVSIPASNFTGALQGMEQTVLTSGAPAGAAYNGDFGNKDDAGYIIALGAGEENLTADFGYNFNSNDEVNGTCFNLLANNGFETHSGLTFNNTPFADFGGNSYPAFDWVLNDNSSLAPWISAPTQLPPPALDNYLIDNTSGTFNNPEGDYFAFLPGGSSTASSCAEYSVNDMNGTLVNGNSYELCFMAASGSSLPATASIELANSSTFAITSLYTETLPVSSSDTQLAWQEVCHTFTYDNSYDRLVISQSGNAGMALDSAFLCETGNYPGGTGNAALGDRVWIDSDANGAQDPNEIGVEGVVVQLIAAGPDGLFGTGDDVNGATDTTDANGYYLFDNLPAGAYQVRVINSSSANHNVLASYTQTGDPDHYGTTGINNDNLSTTPIVLAPGDVFLNADFGYTPPELLPLGAIGDTIWFDADADGNGMNQAAADGSGAVNQGNGAQNDSNEYGIAGVTVALIKDSNGNGVWDTNEPIIATDTTNQLGQYLFEDLPITDGAGTDDYLVWVNDTDNVLQGLTATYDADGAAPASGQITGLGISAATNLGSSDMSQDFGYTPDGHSNGDGMIGDTIWLNIDGADNGQQGNEPSIEGVVVTLTDSNGNIFTTTTDENGHYVFGGLNPTATYTVTIVPSNFAAGGVLEGLVNTDAPDSSPAGTTQTVVNLNTTGPIDLTEDFGFTPPSNAGQLGNLVWLDDNADGNWDGDSGTIGSADTDGDEPILDSVTVDLYRDLNGNGIVDVGEPRFSTAVTANSLSTTGGDDGNYLFTGLPTADNGTGCGGSTYIVNVTDVNGVLAGYWHSIGETGLTDNSQTTPYGDSANATNNLCLTSGNATNVTADFGYYYEPAAVGNFVWLDANNNGVQDNGEGGLDGVIVTMMVTYPDGTMVTLKTMTGNDPSTLATEEGWYSFGNLLLDEDYNSGDSAAEPIFNIKMEDIPANYALTIADTTASGGNDQNDSDESGVQAMPIQGLTDTVQNSNPTAEGNPNATYDFGLVEGVAIGNLVWLDANGDSFSFGEDGIDGVEVHLYRSGDTPGVDEPVATTNSNGTGFYEFLNVFPGTYFVAVVESSLPVAITGGSPGGNHNPDTTGDSEDPSGDDGTSVDFDGFTISQDFTALPNAQASSDTGDPIGWNDASAYMTIDFGFVTSGSPTALTFVSIQVNQVQQNMIQLLIVFLFFTLGTATLTTVRRQEIGR